MTTCSLYFIFGDLAFKKFEEKWYLTLKIFHYENLGPRCGPFFSSLPLLLPLLLDFLLALLLDLLLAPLLALILSLILPLLLPLLSLLPFL